MIKTGSKSNALSIESSSPTVRENNYCSVHRITLWGLPYAVLLSSSKGGELLNMFRCVWIICLT